MIIKNNSLWKWFILLNICFLILIYRNSISDFFSQIEYRVDYYENEFKGGPNKENYLDSINVSNLFVNPHLRVSSIDCTVFLVSRHRNLMIEDSINELELQILSIGDTLFLRAIDINRKVDGIVITWSILNSNVINDLYSFDPKLFGADKVIDLIRSSSLYIPTLEIMIDTNRNTVVSSSNYYGFRKCIDEFIGFDFFNGVMFDESRLSMRFEE